MVGGGRMVEEITEVGAGIEVVSRGGRRWGRERGTMVEVENSGCRDDYKEDW